MIAKILNNQQNYSLTVNLLLVKIFMGVLRNIKRIISLFLTMQHSSLIVVIYFFTKRQIILIHFQLTIISSYLPIAFQH